MAIMAMDTKINKILSFVLLCFSPFLYSAETLNITPAVTVNQTYSDNINRSVVDEESALVTQTGVLVNAVYKKNKSVLNFNSSSLYSTYSHDSQLNQSNHSLNANTRTTLTDSLTLITGASIRNQSRNEAQFETDDVLFRDTVQTENYNAGLQYNIKTKAHSLQASATYQTAKADDSIGENDGTNFNVTSKSGSGAHHIFWDFQGNYSERENGLRDSQQYQADFKLGLITEYKFNPFVRYYTEDNAGSFRQSNSDLKTTFYGAGFRWLPKPRLIVDVSYNTNAKSNDENSNNDDNSLDFTINWQPTRNTRLLAGHRQRSFGDSFDLQIQHKSRRFTNSLSYTETLQSFTRDNFVTVSSTFLCQNPNAVTLSDCFIELGDSSTGEPILFTINTLELVNDINYTLNKSLSWNSSVKLSRTNFTLNVINSIRENLDSDQENTTRTLEFKAQRKLGKNTSLDFLTSYNEREFNRNTDSQQSDISRRYKIGLNKLISKQLTVSFDLEHANRSSSRNFLTYEENRILAKISKEF